MLVLSKIHPLKCCDFVNKRGFPVSSPRFTVVFPDFQRNNTQGGYYHLNVLENNIHIKYLSYFENFFGGNCKFVAADLSETDRIPEFVENTAEIP